MHLQQILLCFAFVLFAVAAVVYNRPDPNPWGWGRFIAAGLACWTASILFASF